MSRKISVKCVDGSRFDFDAIGHRFELSDAIVSPFIVFDIDDGKKFINVYNIVSITDINTDNE